VKNEKQHVNFAKVLNFGKVFLITNYFHNNA